MSLSRIRTGVIAALVVTAIGVSTQSAAAKPVTPRIPKNHTVQMITEDGKQRFDPAELTIQQGDTVTWLAVSGSHNVGFWADSIPKGAEDVLRKAMPDTIAPLLGPRKPTKGDTYVIVFNDAPKGTYKYFCKPHLAKMMVGTLTVK
ncbi:MAG: plastocyanin/azurin family copper-binding protein [Gemmatimonas sp.]